jgi:hypothetical protein
MAKKYDGKKISMTPGEIRGIAAPSVGIIPLFQQATSTWIKTLGAARWEGAQGSFFLLSLLFPFSC